MKGIASPVGSQPNLRRPRSMRAIVLGDSARSRSAMRGASMLQSIAVHAGVMYGEMTSSQHSQRTSHWLRGPYLPMGPSGPAALTAAGLNHWRPYVEASQRQHQPG